MFLSLAKAYTEALNKGDVPNILSSLDRVIEAETRKYCNEAH